MESPASRWRNFGLGAALLACAGLAAFLSPFEPNFSAASFDWSTALRNKLFPARNVPSQEVVVILLDDESNRRLGQPFHKPIDRALYARLIDRLTSENAKAVALDILFDEPGIDSAADSLLASSITRNGKAVLAANTEVATDGTHSLAKSILPIPLFASSAAALGLVRVMSRAQPDGIVREIFTGIESGPPVTNSLSWAVGRLTGTIGDSDESTRLIPRWFNYYDLPQRCLSEISFWRALDPGELKPGYFRDKVVFVGAKSAVGFPGDAKDEFAIPRLQLAADFASGVELHALSFLNLARRDWLSRADPWAEFITLLAAGVAIAGILVFGPSRTALLLGILWLATAASSFLFVHYLNIWWNWLIPVVVQFPVALLLGSAYWLPRKRIGRLGGELTAPAPFNAPTVDLLPTANGPDTFQIPDHVLIRKIGHGSYGEVWLAKTVLGTYRAIKIMRGTSGANRALAREYEGIRNFEPLSRAHEGLVDVLQVGGIPESGYFYYVMELADDETNLTIDSEHYVPRSLDRELARRQRLPISECVDLGRKLASALDFLHSKGIVHRDVKPANIIFVNGEPKLADAGLACSPTEQATIVGTPEYLPRDQWGTFQADLFSLGKVLYVCATGLKPHDFPTILPKWEDLESTADERLFLAFLEKACSIRATERFNSAEEFLEELSRYFDCET